MFQPEHKSTHHKSPHTHLGPLHYVGADPEFLSPDLTLHRIQHNTICLSSLHTREMGAAFCNNKFAQACIKHLLCTRPRCCATKSSIWFLVPPLKRIKVWCHKDMAKLQEDNRGEMLRKYTHLITKGLDRPPPPLHSPGCGSQGWLPLLLTLLWGDLSQHDFL